MGIGLNELLIILCIVLILLGFTSGFIFLIYRSIQRK